MNKSWVFVSFNVHFIDKDNNTKSASFKQMLKEYVDSLEIFSGYITICWFERFRIYPTLCKTSSVHYLIAFDFKFDYFFLNEFYALIVIAAGLSVFVFRVILRLSLCYYVICQFFGCIWEATHVGPEKQSRMQQEFQFHKQHQSKSKALSLFKTLFVKSTVCGIASQLLPHPDFDIAAHLLHA